MRLHAAIIPPSAVLDALADALHPSMMQSRSETSGRDHPSFRKGFLGRIGKRDADTHARGSHVGTQLLDRELDLIPPDRMSLPLAGFGNVTGGDIARLTEALHTATFGKEPASVRLSGGTALEFPSDRCVWAKLAGDVAAVTAMAREVNQVVERLGFYVDRRQYRPWLAVATINDETTADHLQAVIDALDAFEGEPWTVDYVSLARTSYDAGHASLNVVNRMPVAPA